MALRDWNRPGPRKSGLTQSSLSERREAARLLAMWDRFFADGVVPSLDDLKLFLGTDGWNRRFLVAQDPDPPSSVFLTCGPSLTTILGESVKGRTLRDIVWTGCRPLFDACVEAARRRRPISVEGILQSQADLTFPFRAIVLPFGGGKDSIPYLFGTVGWIGAAGAADPSPGAG